MLINISGDTKKLLRIIDNFHVKRHMEERNLEISPKKLEVFKNKLVHNLQLIDTLSFLLQNQSIRVHTILRFD